MKLIFGAANTPGSWLIRFFTFSEYSHVGHVMGNLVIEAHFPRVRQITLDEFKEHYPKWEVGELDVPDDNAAWEFSKAQLGKLYDVGGLIALPFQRRDWESPTRWFCSEEIVAAANSAGANYFRESERNRITPNELYIITR